MSPQAPQLPSRPPVITVLGHVDHGKTSLLDRIRNANIAAKEAGGITQAIGAYQIEFLGKPLTFIDTPGHAAFSKMRARGGKVADVAILVVAADDGVMPQTKESIEHINNAGIPYVVAINKIDLPDANALKVKQDLAETGQYVEGYGGNIPVAEISAKTGQGVDQLLETVLLLVEMEELKDTSDEATTAVVIESQLHPNKGPLATLLVKTGRLSEKDGLYAGSEKIGKIRLLTSSFGKNLTEAPPSTPVQVLGFTAVPQVGDIITTSPSPYQGEGQGEVSPSRVEGDQGGVSLPTPVIKPSVIIKADLAGSLEAILGSLPDTVKVVSSSVGAPTESDVSLASAEEAIIVCFNTKVSSNVAKLAQVEKVEISSFNIIYELFDYLSDLAEKHGQVKEPEIIGEAKVLKTFPFDKQIVLGCIVTAGKIKLGNAVNDSKIISLRIGKEIVKEAKKGEECGVILEPQLDFKPGDSIITHNV